MGDEERRNRKNYYFTGRGYIVSWQTLTVRTKDSAGGEKKAWQRKPANHWAGGFRRRYLKE